MTAATLPIMRKRRMKITPARVILGAVLVSFAILVIYPLFWMAISGFKTNAELYGDPWGLPGEWRIQNYVRAYEYGVVHYIGNSFIVTAGSIVLVVLVSSFAAFALVRVKIPFNGLLTGLILGGLMLSETVALVPLFRIMKAIGLYNSLFGIIILYTAFRVPFITFLIRAYMIDLPQEVFDSAVVDGCNTWQIFWRITMPLCFPILISAAILQALFSWNEFVFALVFIKDDVLKTMPVGLMALQSRLTTNWPVVFAGLTIAALPMVLAFLFGQRHFVKGITEGIGK
ncbi:MAG: carbohydrate ABC transporter permease [Propionibacteriaceae bacterium]|jgi:raffinose/stachyose/melibiose transport system permease protein|nr:carbohydrate ABC transporter permease [Propionibacteriaceae bacterium]